SLSAKPRMADFAKWIVAAEPALPWPTGAFMAAYSENRCERNVLALEHSLIAAPLLELMTTAGEWQGTAQDLLDVLEHRADERSRKHKDWPTNPRKLSGDLRRIAPNLRAEGILVDFDKREPGGKRRRLIRLEHAGKTSSQASRPSQPSENTEKNGKA